MALTTTFPRSSWVLVVLLMFGSGWRLACAQDPVRAFPGNYRSVLENSAVSVMRVHYGPHEKVGVHDHSAYPTVYVYLSDSPPVRFIHDEQPPFALTRPPIKAGAFRVSPGRRERHSVENLGNASSDFLRVEFKQIPFGGVQPFRGEAPGSLAKTADNVPVRSPFLEIQRVVCASSQCPVLRESPTPSVVIAFTPMLFISAPITGKTMKYVKAGEVWELPAGKGGMLSPAGQSSAHVLRITVKNGKPQPNAGK